MTDWTPTIAVQLDDGARMPHRAYPTDAGADVFAPHGFLLLSHCAVTVDTGVHVQLPPHTKLEVVAKSGLNINHDIICLGLVDEGYTGTIAVKLYNMGWRPHRFHAGDKLAQLVVSPVLYPKFERVDEVSGGPRGSNGFGSTGER